ncbi:SgcJ/EcaC family oxidoreductase [Mycobacterium sp. DL99]|uniref:SgcJ/EcaC family oxidoreductase n=1 Tax=Mycobacterium sp. DL99 TaxID=2528957 RepID=UPI0010810D4C|nr:SgcJ/EcaC family oxidoreductase [Mycobacterium sp. DL99]
MNAKDQQDIGAVMSAATDLWVAHDMDGWGRLFTEDADFVAHSGLWWTSRGANVDGHRDVPEAVVRQKRNYTQRVEAIAEIVPGVALVHTRWDWPDHVQPGAGAEDRSGIISYVLVEHDGRWLIRSAHNTRVS